MREAPQHRDSLPKLLRDLSRARREGKLDETEESRAFWKSVTRPFQEIADNGRDCDDIGADYDPNNNDDDEYDPEDDGDYFIPSREVLQISAPQERAARTRAEYRMRGAEKRASSTAQTRGGRISKTSATRRQQQQQQQQQARGNGTRYAGEMAAPNRMSIDNLRRRSERLNGLKRKASGSARRSQSK